MAERSNSGADVLTVGVIGLGGMGVGHCRNIVRNVAELKLTAVCDADAQQARKVGEELSVAFFGSHRDLIDSGLCRAAIVATPHPLHAPIAIDCLKAGLHVLSEKPLAEAVSAADAMVRAADEAGRTLAVMYQMRFIPAVRRAIEMVRSGGLGRVIRAALIAPDYRTQAYYDAGRWRGTWVGEGGGVLLNQAPHLMDLMLNMTGPPVWVQGVASAVTHDIEVEDCAQALLRFPEGGFGYLYCSTIEPGPAQSIEVYAERGKIIYRDEQVKVYRFADEVRGYTRKCDDMWSRLACTEVPLEVENRPGGHADVMRNFAAHILRGEPLVCDGRSAVAQVELANAIIYSSRKGAPVELPLNRAAYDALLAELRRNSRYHTRSDVIKRVTDPSCMA